VVGGEDALWDEFMKIHQREQFLLDVEGIPDSSIEVLLVALAAKDNVLTQERSSTSPDRFLAHSESLFWGVDYEKVYVHSGAMDVLPLSRRFSGRTGYANRAANRRSWSSARVASAIRHLLLKTGAEDDFHLAVELMETNVMATRLSSIKGVDAGCEVAGRSLFQGAHLSVPLDVTLPAYFYPFKLMGDLRSETEEWMSLRPIVRLNMAYYRHIMLQGAWGWASFSSSASGHVWRPNAPNPSADEAAQIEHGMELVQRRSEYAISLHDSILRSACAHMYGWAPSKEVLLSFGSERFQFMGLTDFTLIDLGNLFIGHTIPHGVHPYAELWLANKLPDYLVLPVPEGTVKWPDDKARPVTDSASDTSQVRLGATMAPLDYKY
jgi:hypothetical protein